MYHKWLKDEPLLFPSESYSTGDKDLFVEGGLELGRTVGQRSLKIINLWFR